VPPGAGARRDRDAPGKRTGIDAVRSVPFLLVHLTPLLLIVTGVSWRAAVLFAMTLWGRLFCITAGYHRYFAHRSYKLARFPQFVLAFAGTTAAQKGPLWWAGHHRVHHRFADTPRDLHSPTQGFWWSHVGWILSDRYAATDLDSIRDFARYRELRFLDRHDWIGPWLLAFVCFAVAGWKGLVLGFFCSTVVLWHTTFLINSLAHVMGRRTYETDDTSRNSVVLAVLTLGEGWHNNHHYWPSSARQGFRWWQWDPTYYGLQVLSWLGLVRELRRVPTWARARNHADRSTGRDRSRPDRRGPGRPTVAIAAGGVAGDAVLERGPADAGEGSAPRDRYRASG